MAGSSGNLLIGAGVVTIGAWVTNGGAGTLADVGYIEAGIVLQDTAEDFLAETENTQGALKSVPMRKTVTLQIPMAEATLANWKLAMRQAAANLTGTVPNQTLLVKNETETYYQAQVVTKGPGTTGVRTITLWRLAGNAREAVTFTKSGKQVLNVTFNVLEDDSFSAGGSQWYKIVDA